MYGRTKHIQNPIVEKNLTRRGKIAVVTTRRCIYQMVNAGDLLGKRN
jgi:hypothetical protein